MKQIKSALISVFYKDGLDTLVQTLHAQGVTLYSTGGTQQFIESLGVPVVPVEALTSYPSILGGRVKTLHPKVFGGILARRAVAEDEQQLKQYSIPELDLVVVDLYPFEETVASGAGEADIIEKIDIGGISLIRAAAKNFQDVLIVSSRTQYGRVEALLKAGNGSVSLEARKQFAAEAFHVSSHYDSAIFNYFNAALPEAEQLLAYKASFPTGHVLRYGENPHQKGVFFGDMDALFTKLSGKELSYNNLIDVDAAIALIDEFPAEESAAFAILKHNNACGMATATSSAAAYQKALQADPVSAFGGVLVCNQTIDLPAAQAMHELFFEVLIAPDFTVEALSLLTSKKNRILLQRKQTEMPSFLYRTLLNGVIGQSKDAKTETAADLTTATTRQPTDEEVRALLFANKLVKHTKSNTIVLAKEGQLFASGTGQTSRVDALRQAIHKAKSFGFDLSEAVMASDAFFPFPDCVEIARQEGIRTVIQPGGSIRDNDSVDYCNAHDMAMVMTGVRHFRH